MLSFETNSIFIIKGEISLSTSDEEMLTKCYQPMVGSTAFSLYHTLLFINREDPFLTSSYLESVAMNNLTQVSQDIHRLEAVGLLATYREETETKVTYIIKIFKPQVAQTFFANIMLATLLESKIGPRKIKALITSLRDKDTIPSGFVDVSAKFNDVFEVSPSFEDYQDYKEVSNNVKKDYVNSPQLVFNKDEFLSLLKENQIDVSSLQNDMVEIERISDLFGIDEQIACDYISERCISSYGVFNLQSYLSFAKNYHHFRLEKTEEGYQTSFGTSDFAKRTNLMQSMAPVVFLQNLLQSELPESYLRLLDELSKTYACPNPVINCVLDYTVQKCQGSIPNQFVYKVVVTLMHNKITTAQDALAFLYQGNESLLEKKRKNKKELTKLSKKISTEDEEKPTKKDEKPTEGDNIDDILGDII